MKQDEIIEIAKDVGIKYNPVLQEFHSEFCNGVVLEDIEEFVKLVADKEREACAKVCDELPAPDIYSDTDKSMWDVTCIDCAEAIRARGQA